MPLFTQLAVPITITQGNSFDDFAKLDVTWSTFGYGQADHKSPDYYAPFSTQGFQLINLTVDGYETSQTWPSSNVIEYSFNGSDVSGELGSGRSNVALTFNNRVNCLMWFRVQAGSSSSVVSIQAWGIR